MAQMETQRPDYDSTDAGVAPNDSTSGYVGYGATRVVEYSDFWSDHYKMDHKSRGTAVIISNSQFDQRLGLKKRIDNDKDLTEVNGLLEEIGFKDIKVEQQLTAGAMLTCFGSVAKTSFTDQDCFVCVILSYGDQGYIYGTDKAVEMEKITAPFKVNASLAGKPKLFIIKTCAERQDGKGVDTDAEGGESVDVRRIPADADFLMFHSVNSDALFIQVLIEVVRKNHQEKDLLTMLTDVIGAVSADNTMIPCISSTLTKDLFFCKRPE